MALGSARESLARVPLLRDRQTAASHVADSLRAAIQETNVATTGTDVINFSLPANSIITLGTALDVIGGAVTINGPGADILTEHGPLLVAGAMLWFAGLMLFSTGLIGEVLMRTYFESQGRRIYAVREVRCRREQVIDGGR